MYSSHSVTLCTSLRAPRPPIPSFYLTAIYTARFSVGAVELGSGGPYHTGLPCSGRLRRSRRTGSILSISRKAERSKLLLPGQDPKLTCRMDAEYKAPHATQTRAWTKERFLAAINWCHSQIMQSYGLAAIRHLQDVGCNCKHYFDIPASSEDW